VKTIIAMGVLLLAVNSGYAKSYNCEHHNRFTHLGGISAEGVHIELFKCSTWEKIRLESPALGYPEVSRWGGISQTGWGNVDIEASTTGDILESDDGSVKIRSSITMNIAEKDKGDVIVRAGNVTYNTITKHYRSECRDISEAGEGYVLIKDSNVQWIRENEKGDVVLESAIAGNIDESGIGKVLMQKGGSAQNIREKGTGSVIIKYGGVRNESTSIIKRFVMVNAISEDEKGDVTVTEASVSGKIWEKGSGDVIIKNSKVHNISEANKGRVVLCKGAVVTGNVSEQGEGDCIFELGIKIYGKHTCIPYGGFGLHMKRIPKCVNLK